MNLHLRYLMIYGNWTSQRGANERQQKKANEHGEIEVEKYTAKIFVIF